MLTALPNPLGLGSSAGNQPGLPGWTLVALLIATGLMALIALTRAGIRHFWASHDRPTPQLRVAEGLPIAVLLAACVVLTVRADSVMRYMQATANVLHAPSTYVRAVMSARPVPGPVSSGAPADAAAVQGIAGGTP